MLDNGGEFNIVIVTHNLNISKAVKSHILVEYLILCAIQNILIGIVHIGKFPQGECRAVYMFIFGREQTLGIVEFY